MKAVAAAFYVSARDRLRYRAEWLGMAAFLALLVFIFSRLWLTVAAQGGAAAGPYGVSQLVLYLVVAELVILSPSNAHQRISDEVKSGAASMALLRPVSYVSWELAREYGAGMVRMVVLVAAGLPTAFLLGGVPRLDPRGLAIGLGLLVPAAIAVETGVRVLVGLLAFWVEESAPLYWIWQKASFVLGGLMIPIDLYPQWLQRLTRLLPFEALLYGPARTVVAYDAAFARLALLKLVLWGAIILAALNAVYALGRRRLEQNGG